MSGLNTNELNGYRFASGTLKDGWTYDIERMPKTNRFRAIVLHPYGDAPSGGVPWPIEDPSLDVVSAHPTYLTVEEAILAAEKYVDMLSELRGYPDPDKMSPKGFRPTIW